MPELPTAFADGLGGSVLRHALCWRIVRADGVSVGVTDHDRDLGFKGTDFVPGANLSVSGLTRRAGLAPDPASLSGVFEDDRMTDGDLEAGLWDGARVFIYRVDWSSGPDLPDDAGVLIWIGRLTRVRRKGAAFEADLVSLKADLERRVGRTLQRRCDARLGDARCGVDLSDPNFADAQCDKRFETCRARFNNAQNFRGFPDLIGNDALISGPDDRRDGSSRRR